MYHFQGHESGRLALTFSLDSECHDPKRNAVSFRSILVIIIQAKSGAACKSFLKMGARRQFNGI